MEVHIYVVPLQLAAVDRELALDLLDERERLRLTDCAQLLARRDRLTRFLSSPRACGLSHPSITLQGLLEEF